MKDKMLNQKQLAELKRIRKSIISIYCSSEMYEPEVKSSNIPFLMKTIMTNLDIIINYLEGK